MPGWQVSHPELLPLRATSSLVFSLLLLELSATLYRCSCAYFGGLGTGLGFLSC